MLPQLLDGALVVHVVRLLKQNKTALQSTKSKLKSTQRLVHNMASNIIKKLPIDIGNLFEQITDAITGELQNMDITGIGDEADSNFEIEEVEVKFIDGMPHADIYLNRTEGRFCSNADIEEAVIAEIGSLSITIEIQIQA